jgi:peptide chain release factor 2
MCFPSSRGNLTVFGVIFDPDSRRKALEATETKASDPSIWNDPQSAQQLLQQRSRLQESLDLFERLSKKLEDLEAFFELAREASDDDVVRELKEELAAFDTEISRIEIEMLLSGENDRLNAIMEIHPGAGGTESQDWAEMLLRMYLRWAERKGFRAQMLDTQEGEEAGIKSVTLLINGEFAFGYLSCESGVHRLVRISPFDAGARRHTSFASVFVSPEVDGHFEVEIEEKDLKVDTYRSSGAGGQHVNVTDSAVRITHLPTGIVVQCQNERSQHRNREMAMKVLRSRLYELEMEKRKAEADVIENSKKDIAWGSQIRSYVLHPYRMVKDHRTKYEVGDADRVLDGDIDEFINNYLVRRKAAEVAGV